MRPLPSKFFGPSGLPCLLTIDGDGNTAVGYFVKQLGARRFVATVDGDTTFVVVLAQTSEDVASMSVMPVGTCTILVTQYGGSAENVRQITEYRCSTIQGNTVPWHAESPTPTLAGITTPVLDSGDSYLLETGDFWLLEDGTHWELET